MQIASMVCICPIWETYLFGELIVCLAIPAQISRLLDDGCQMATVELLGVRRKVNLELLKDEAPAVGDWVLVHVGFAMSRISEQQAVEQLQMLAALGEQSAAEEEAANYPVEQDGADHEIRR